MPDIYPSKDYFKEAVDKHLTPIMLKKLEEKMKEPQFGSTKGRKNMIAEKYQNLSPEELSDLVLEGEEVFSRKKKRPSISGSPEACASPYWDTLVCNVVPHVEADSVDIKRSVVSASFILDTSNHNGYRVYDRDLSALKNGKSLAHPSQLLIR